MGEFFLILILFVIVCLPAVSAQTTLPSCTTLIAFPDDNDGIDQAIDIDKDNDGLIEICDLEGLDEIRYQLDGAGYKTSAGAVVIMTGCPADGCEGYELTKDLDFTDNNSYRTTANKVMWTADKDRTNAGWPPIAPLTAIFEGNDYTIDNLYININDGTTMGLFRFILSEIRNVNLSNVDISGGDVVGGLVGLNGGLISNSRMTGSVSGTLSDSSSLGGLVGVNGINAQINNSSAIGTVTGSVDIGGLVGFNNSIIRNSFASGTVTGSNNIGGLSGLIANDAVVINSYADSTVNGTETDDTHIGGLIGISSGFIMGSHASGAVNVDAQGNDVNVGGLVGYNFSLIVNSYATGATGGNSSVGGLVGLSEEGMSDSLMNVPIIINSYATGDATGTGNNNKNIGGLIGYNNKARVINTYAEGDVSGISNAGGLIGLLELGTIENSYTIGAVRGTGDDNQTLGGMVGATSSTVIITDSYWNRDTAEQTTSAGGTSKTTVELRSPTAPGSISTEVYYNWNPDYPSRADWDFGDSQSYPALRYAVGLENNAACDDDPDTLLPQCSLLLPDQPGRDRGLDFVFFLSDVDNAILELVPSFSPLIEQYKIVVSDNLETMQLRPFAVNTGTATITITKRGESPQRNYLADMNSGDTSSAITLNDTTTTLVITVTETVNGAELNGVYEFDISPLVAPAIMVSENGIIDEDNTVDERTRVTLSTTIDNGSGNYSYEWTQTEGEPLMLSDTSTALPSFTIPANYIESATIPSTDVVIQLTLRDIRFNTMFNLSIKITVKKINNGFPMIDSSLTVNGLNFNVGSVINELDPDDSTTGTLSYQWQHSDIGADNWVDIPSATTAGYTVSSDAPSDRRYRVEVTYTDTQGYTVSEYLTEGQPPDLVSLTVVEPTNAELSMQNELTYLLRIADDITRVVLNATADNADTTISYSINNVDFNVVAGGDSLTIDPLPTAATVIIIRLESPESNVRSVDYTVRIERVRIERVQSIRSFIQVRVFLEGALEETPP